MGHNSKFFGVAEGDTLSFEKTSSSLDIVVKKIELQNPSKVEIDYFMKGTFDDEDCARHGSLVISERSQYLVQGVQLRVFGSYSKGKVKLRATVSGNYSMSHKKATKSS